LPLFVCIFFVCFCFLNILAYKHIHFPHFLFVPYLPHSPVMLQTISGSFILFIIYLSLDRESFVRSWVFALTGHGFLHGPPPACLLPIGSPSRSWLCYYTVMSLVSIPMAAGNMHTRREGLCSPPSVFEELCLVMGSVYAGAFSLAQPSWKLWTVTGHTSVCRISASSCCPPKGTTWLPWDLPSHASQILLLRAVTQSKSNACLNSQATLALQGLPLHKGGTGGVPPGSLITYLSLLLLLPSRTVPSLAQ
jgi:hypothetical protein